MATYTVTPHHDSQTGCEITTTSYRKARKIAASFRDHYHQGVTIERDEERVDWWRRDQNDNGSKWYRAAI